MITENVFANRPKTHVTMDDHPPRINANVKTKRISSSEQERFVALLMGMFSYGCVVKNKTEDKNDTRIENNLSPESQMKYVIKLIKVIFCVLLIFYNLIIIDIDVPTYLGSMSTMANMNLNVI